MASCPVHRAAAPLPISRRNVAEEECHRTTDDALSKACGVCRFLLRGVAGLSSPPCPRRFRRAVRAALPTHRKSARYMGRRTPRSLSRVQAGLLLRLHRRASRYPLGNYSSFAFLLGRTARLRRSRAYSAANRWPQGQWACARTRMRAHSIGLTRRCENYATRRFFPPQYITVRPSDIARVLYVSVRTPCPRRFFRAHRPRSPPPSGRPPPSEGTRPTAAHPPQ